MSSAIEITSQASEALSRPWELLAVVMPSLAVAYFVLRQSKVVAAFAQLNDLQGREDNRRMLAEKALGVDKNWYIMGASNVGLTSYILGAAPSLYYIYYTPKVISLILLRFVKFRQKKQHYLLWDFCYWANYLCLFYCWLMPSSPAVFRTMFMCSNGPLAWSVLAFNHAMIFHSYAHVTSVVVHVSPLLLTYGLRWYGAPMSNSAGAAHFKVCDTDLESCVQVPYLTLIFDGLGRFYIWWLIMYYVFIFFALGKRIEERGYQTLWDRILVMKPIGPLLKKLLEWFPKLLVQLVYLMIHLVFSTVTMCLAALLWYSQIAHLAFMGAICFATLRNGATFYFDIFENQYLAATDSSYAAATASGKKLVAASPALAELQKRD
eukprot:TRINITY_DN65102_c0_g1_i1.p1 TRINITY_DN65102_c0_g1~~TRINITY_DN65102_c0_g1_i1.p1  ORF type:complete len:395 (+),score=51.20 TRINITY_DN65102_c0_g1_i1:53-1186(+)